MKDPYIYPGTDVLKNKLNIKDNDRLSFVEKEITVPRLREIEFGYIKGNFDIQHIKNIHKHIFGDIYEWAGNLRTIDIEKHEKVLGGLSVEYSKSKNIQKDIENGLNELKSTEWNKLNLDEKVHEFSRIMSDVWKAHGFREGNTRTTINFFGQFAKENGFPLNLKLLENNSSFVRNSLVAASFPMNEKEKYGELSHLKRIIKDSIKQGSVEYKIKQVYMKEIPSIKYASSELIDNIYNVNKELSEDGKYLSIKNIKAKYKELGKKVEEGLLNENDSTFKLISNVNNEIKILQVRNKDIDKNITNEKIKNISMETEL